MRFNPIIKSTLWTDLYKLTMQQAIMRQSVVGVNLDDIEVEYAFIDRNNWQYPVGFVDELKEQVEVMSEAKASPSELVALRHRCPFFSYSYIDYLRNYRFNPKEVTILEPDVESGQKSPRITVRAPWVRGILWEVPLMTTISALYYKMKGIKPDEHYLDRAKKKAILMEEMKVPYIEFGTRRAFFSICSSQCPRNP